MSLAAKPRAAAPQPPQSAATQKKELSQNGGAPCSTNLTKPADVTDGLISLDVTLPSGQRMDISVDYNTAMLDLLVSLAAQTKLNPTGLVLILISELTGKALSYKPNQTIGALGGRVVRIVNKDAGKSSARGTNNERPFEVTHRFTVNFPRGQKTVVRISPLMTLAELLTTVCEDKGLDLDLSKYVLQIPGKPGVGVDLGATIEQVGVYEMNLVTVSVIPNRKHTVSMPDLSRSTVSRDKSLSTNSTAGDHQKKKGLLSFLGKKDKKHKSNNMESGPSTSVQSNASRLQATPPGSQKQECCPENQLKRPQSVPAPSNTSREYSPSLQQDSQSTPAHKKRQAPAPPAPTNTDSVYSAAPTYSLSVGDHVKTSSEGDICGQETEQTVHHKKHALTRQTASDKEPDCTSAGIAQPQVSLLNHIHSCNSSDSSGYHELTLSGCESPEATHISGTKHQNRIDSASIESSDKSNMDCTVQELPVRVSPTVQLQEQPEVSLHTGLVAGNTDTLLSSKKRKAPAPPTAQTSPSFSPAELTTVLKVITPSATAVTLEPLTVSVHDTATNIGNHKQDKLPDTNYGLDCAEFPDRAVYNGPLQSIEFIFATQSNGERNDPGMMMMMETASVVSENIEQVDISSHGHRPCSFIPPPPPLEPPPGEQVVENLYSQTDDTCIEKATVISDDNTPVTPVHSPVAVHGRKNSHISVGSTDTVEGISLDFQQAIQLGEEACSLSLNNMEACVGYKSEMALFVERMSKLAVENAEKAKCEELDDSGSSLSLPCSDSNYDTESVIRHHHVDSSSEAGSLTTREGKQLQTNFNDCQENVQAQAVEPLVCCEEMGPTVTLRPPPEFDDTNDSFINMRNHSSIFEKSYSSIDERSHSPIDETSHRSLDGRSHSSIDARNNISIDERSHSSIDERSHISIDKRNHSSIDERNHSSTDERSHSPIDERSHHSIDKRNHNKIDERSHSSTDEKSHIKDNESNFNESAQESFNQIELMSAPNFSDKAIELEQSVKQTSKPSGTFVIRDTFTDHNVKSRRISDISDTLTDNRVKDSETGGKSDIFTDVTVMSCERLANIDSLGFTGIVTDPRDCSTIQLTQVSHCLPTVVEAQAHSTPAAKEEIILTTEDLSNVSFLPSKSKKAKSIHIQPYVQTQPYVRLSTTSLMMANHSRLPDNNDRTVISTAELVQARNSSSLLGHETAVSEKSSDDLPSTKPLMHASSIHVVSNDDIHAGIDPLLTKSRPRLLMNSSNNPWRKSTLDQIQRDRNDNKVANHRGSSYQTGKPSSIAANQIDQQRGPITESEQRNIQIASSTAVTIDTIADVADNIPDVADTIPDVADTIADVADRANHPASRLTDDKTSGKLLNKSDHLSSEKSGSTSVAATYVLSSPPTGGQISTTGITGGQISTTGRTETDLISTTDRTGGGLISTTDRTGSDQISTTGRTGGQISTTGRTGTDQILTTGRTVTDQIPTTGRTVTDQIPTTGRTVTDQIPTTGRTGGHISTTGRTGTDQIPTTGRTVTDQIPTTGRTGTDQIPTTGRTVTDQIPTTGRTVTDQIPTTGRTGGQLSTTGRTGGQISTTGRTGTDQIPTTGRTVTDQISTTGRTGTDQIPTTGRTGGQLSTTGRTGGQISTTGRTGTDQIPTTGRTGTDQISTTGRTGTDQIPTTGRTGGQLSTTGRTGGQISTTGRTGTDQIPTTGRTGTDQIPTTGRTVTDQISTTGRTVTDQISTTGRTVTDQIPTTGRTGTDQIPTTGRTVTDQISTTGRTGTDQISTTWRTGTDQISTTGRTVTDQISTTGRTGTDQIPTTGRTGTDQIPTTGRTGTDQVSTTGRTGTDQISTTGRTGGQISTTGRTGIQKSTTGRTVSGTGKQKLKSTLQVQLDPHEQLMTAIRTFSRERMKSVPAETESNQLITESQLAVQ